jgi:hypothetical protein
MVQTATPWRLRPAVLASPAARIQYAASGSKSHGAWTAMWNEIQFLVPKYQTWRPPFGFNQTPMPSLLFTETNVTLYARIYITVYVQLTRNQYRIKTKSKNFKLLKWKSYTELFIWRRTIPTNAATVISIWINDSGWCLRLNLALYKNFFMVLPPSKHIKPHRLRTTALFSGIT